MPKYKARVVAYGYVIVEANDPEDAAMKMYSGEIDVDDYFIVDEYDTDSDEFPDVYHGNRAAAN